MFDQSGIQIFVIVAVFAAAALFTVYMNRSRRKRDAERGLQYVWLAVIGPSNAESTEDTYKSAYLLLAAGLRMELTMSEFLYRGLFGVPRARSRFSNAEKISYSTEGFQPHIRDIASLEDFGRYAPYREDLGMKLSVHPEDADEAVRVLEDAGLTVKRPPGQHFWH